VAVHQFQAAGEGQVTLQFGDQVRVHARTLDWCSGRVVQSGEQGIFPVAYVHLRPAKRHLHEDDPVMHELYSVLVEWNKLLQSYYRKAMRREFGVMRDRLKTLWLMHTELASPTTPLETQKQLRHEIIEKIEEGRRAMGLDVMARNADGQRATLENTAVIQLYRMHQELSSGDASRHLLSASASSPSAYSAVAVAASSSAASTNASRGAAAAQAAAAYAAVVSQSSSASSAFSASALNLADGASSSGSAASSSSSSSSFSSSPSSSFSAGSSSSSSSASSSAASASSGSATEHGDSSRAHKPSGPSLVRGATTRHLIPVGGSSSGGGAAGAGTGGYTESGLTQVLLDFKILMCPVGEPVEVYFSLWNRQDNRRLTEEFQMLLTSQGMPFDHTKINNMKTLFRDLSAEDVCADTYLLCRLVRRGRLVYEGKGAESGGGGGGLGGGGGSSMMSSSGLSGPGMASMAGQAGSSSGGGDERVGYRRPFGFAVMPLGRRLTAEPADTTLQIYAPTHENYFYDMPELVLKKRDVAEVARAKGLVVALRRLDCSYEEACARLGDELSGVPCTRAPSLPSVILPGTVRDDLYVLVDSAEISQDRKRTAKNVEVEMSVRLQNGEIVPNALYVGQSDAPLSVYRSPVIYHTNSPRWNEQVRLAVPVNAFGHAHLFFSLSHCGSGSKGTRPFAQAFLRLTKQSDDTVVDNGQHVLQAFRPAKNIEDPVYYLKGVESGVKLVSRKNETLRIHTTLVSTRLTHNANLLGLLRWKQHINAIDSVLRSFLFVTRAEVLRYAQEILGALFAILEVKNTAVVSLVYDALVHTVTLLVDTRLEKMDSRPALDLYIAEYFQGELVHRYLLPFLREFFSSQQSTKQLISCLKAQEYIFKFIIASHKQDIAAMAQRGEDVRQAELSFKQGVLGLCSAFNFLMTKPEASMIGPQNVALKFFTSWFDDMLTVFNKQELCAIACKFVDSVQYNVSKKQRNASKLLVLEKIATGPLYLHDGARQLLVPTLITQIQKHLESPNVEENAISISIIASLLNTIQSSMQEAAAGCLWDLLTFLPTLLRVIPSFDPYTRMDATACLLAMLYMMRLDHLPKFVTALRSKKEQITFLSGLFLTLEKLALRCAFPDNWLVLCMFQYEACKKVIMLMAGFLAQFFPLQSTVEDSNLEIWSPFLRLCVAVMNAPSLALEHFSASKQQSIRQSHGDMRMVVSEKFTQVWEGFGTLKSRFLFDLMRPLLQLFLQENEPLREVAITSVFGMLVAEYEQTKGVQVTTTQTILSLDSIATSVNPDVLKAFTKQFEVCLRRKISAHPSLGKAGEEYLEGMLSLLSLLLELRTLPLGPEYEDERTIATIELMEYLKRTDRMETYIKYVEMLVQNHCKSSNFVEAGYTLLLHGQMIPWEDTILDAAADFPRQSARDRKESIYLRAVELFNKGKMWEKAIELAKELLHEYDDFLYDYNKVSDLMEQTSTFYRNIVTDQRYFSEYFLVGYYGKGFNRNLRGKQFVYRGFELERIAEFVQRIRRKYPDAELLKSTEAPPASFHETAGQHLQVFNVKPLSSTEFHPNMPLMVREFYENNNVNSFVYAKPFRKGADDKANEFKNLWIRKITYTTADSFPTIHRRTEILQVTQEELSPIENAVATINSKNSELNRLIEQYKLGSQPSLAPFTMVLTGVLDAVVAGGVDKYKSAFFVPQYLAENPSHQSIVNDLKAALNSQLAILDHAMTIHGNLCSGEIKQLQAHLESKLSTLKASWSI